MSKSLKTGKTVRKRLRHTNALQKNFFGKMFLSSLITEMNQSLFMPRCVFTPRRPGSIFQRRACLINRLLRLSAESLICLCLSAIPTVAQVNISGTVVDTLGRPIAGAVVQLVHQNMTDTSAANGKFSFVKSTPIIAKPVVASNGIVLNGDRLTLSLAKSQHVAVDLFNAKGALLSHVMTRNLTAGSHNVTIEADRFGTGIMFVKVLRDGEAETFRFNSVGTNHYSAGLAGDNENATALAKVNALTGDTLTCWKSGFIQARTAISSFIIPSIIDTLRQMPLPTMISIPSGTFMMGADSSTQASGSTNSDGEYVHQVTLTGFSMMETDVTQKQYRAMSGINPSYFDTGVDANLRPVEQVTWYDAALFCNALSKQFGKDTVYTYTSESPGPNGGDTLANVAIDYMKNGYRLPTEAEWEYAAKAGNDSCNYYWGNGSWYWVTHSDSALNANAWNYSNSGSTTHPVGTKPANGFGLYDMSGNVNQWCNDWREAYSTTPQSDPTGTVPAPGDYFLRVHRGGCWGFTDQSAWHTDFRESNFPDQVDNGIGFRVVSRP